MTITMFWQTRLDTSYTQCSIGYKAASMCCCEVAAIKRKTRQSKERQDASSVYLKSVRENVWMCHTPAEWAELHDRDEAGKVEHLALHVLAVLHAAQVEQLCACRHNKALSVSNSGRTALVPAGSNTYCQSAMQLPTA